MKRHLLGVQVSMSPHGYKCKFRADDQMGFGNRPDRPTDRPIARHYERQTNCAHTFRGRPGKELRQRARLVRQCAVFRNKYLRILRSAECAPCARDPYILDAYTHTHRHAFPPTRPRHVQPYQLAAYSEFRSSLFYLRCTRSAWRGAGELMFVARARGYCWVSSHAVRTLAHTCTRAGGSVSITQPGTPGSRSVC